MSFNATWGVADGSADVCAADANEDLVLEKATLSPLLESMAPDIRSIVEEAARAAAGLVAAIDAGAGKGYRVTVSGHARQSETDTSFISVSIAEKVPAPAEAEQPVTE